MSLLVDRLINNMPYILKTFIVSQRGPKLVRICQKPWRYEHTLLSSLVTLGFLSKFFFFKLKKLLKANMDCVAVSRHFRLVTRKTLRNSVNGQ